MSGTTTATGVFRVVVTVTDGASSVTRAFTLFARFNDPQVLSFNLLAAQIADVRVGQSTSVTLAPFGGIPPYNWTLASGSLPPA